MPYYGAAAQGKTMRMKKHMRARLIRLGTTGRVIDSKKTVSNLVCSIRVRVSRIAKTRLCLDGQRFMHAHAHVYLRDGVRISELLFHCESFMFVFFFVGCAKMEHMYYYDCYTIKLKKNIIIKEKENSTP